MFRLEVFFPNGFWVPSIEEERDVVESTPEDKPYFDKLIADPSKYQEEAEKPLLHVVLVLQEPVRQPEVLVRRRSIQHLGVLLSFGRQRGRDRC